MSNKLTQNLTEATVVNKTSDRVPIYSAASPDELRFMTPDNLVPDASTTVEGKVELSTDAEALSKADTARAMTPSNMAALFIDEDSMTTDSATRMPSQQSVKAYVDTHAALTAAHGATGAVVGTTNTQTLTNKTLTNPVINYTDTTIGMNVKSRAARTTAQSVPNATITKMQLSTETYDIGGDFDNATNYRFTAPVTGYYLVCAQVSYASAGDQSIEQLDVLKNGADFIRSSARASGTGNGSVQAMDIVALTATDYLELWFSHGTGAGEYCTGFMAVHLLSI